MFNHFIFVLIFYNMNLISKLIHQIWIGTKKIPNYWSNTFSELYIENNNDYEYKIWTNNNYLNELNKYFAYLTLKKDSPNIITGFFDSIIALEILFLFSIISLIV